MPLALATTTVAAALLIVVVVAAEPSGVDVVPPSPASDPADAESSVAVSIVMSLVVAVVVVGDGAQDEEAGDHRDDREHDAQRRSDGRAGVTDAWCALAAPPLGLRARPLRCVGHAMCPSLPVGESLSVRREVSRSSADTARVERVPPFRSAS